jgi:hypothetical protein
MCPFYLPLPFRGSQKRPQGQAIWLCTPIAFTQAGSILRKNEAGGPVPVALRRWENWGGLGQGREQGRGGGLGQGQK